MGFQGDVAGIGLGELLQGLARGGREGVLTLHGAGRTATVGLRNGQLLLLPEPDEDPETWRRRAARAWIVDDQSRVDVMRMKEIATAARMEGMFLLLDAEGVHFRFEPGPLPDAPPEPDAQDGEGASGAPRLGPSAVGAVHCAPISVEFLLLEYARLGDETQGLGDVNAISPHDVPRPLDAGSPPQELERFWQQCDGMSCVNEISDRLGWPLRRCRATVLEQVVRQNVRLADGREMLVLAQRELACGRYERAASRLSGWIRYSHLGAVASGDVELLLGEWEAGHLLPLLRSMEPPFARSLLRRLDAMQGDWSASLLRWQELRKHHAHDLIAEWREVLCRIRAGSEDTLPQVGQLLRLARAFQDADRPWRAGVLLRVVAAMQPENPSTRLELGTRLLACGYVDDAGPWIVDSARAFVESGMAEKAIPPLRALVEAHPSHREARRMLGIARARSAEGRRRRRNLLVVLSILVLVGSAAVVKVRLDLDFERRLAEVQDASDRPAEALELLRSHFGNDQDPRVLDLRDALQKRLRLDEEHLRDEWLNRFRDVQTECTMGDPALGLAEVLEMPPPPELKYVREKWPAIDDLLTGLVGQLEDTVSHWPEPTPDPSLAEERMHRMVEALGEQARASEGQTERDLGPFLEGIDALLARLDARAEKRHEMITAIERKKTLETQNDLLARARAHAQAYDLERAAATYEELFDLDQSGKLRHVLAQEYGEVTSQRDAVLEALDLCRQGRHAEAVALMREKLPQPGAFLLPWTLETHPPGGRVRFADGTVRVAPFQMDSAIGEPVEIHVELPGHEPLDLSFDEPADRYIVLSRAPDLAWRTADVVEAPPVAVKDDYVLCDRAGRLACVAPGGEILWSHDLETLGGIARAPVFLPRKPGWLVTLTEDGEAYLVEASGGQLQGPWTMDSPPIWGPVATGTSVLAYFRSGSTAEWESRLRPEIGRSAGGIPDEESRSGSDAGLAILRSGTDGPGRLRSHSGEWNVTVLDELYRVTGPGEAEFFVRREGDWTYLAWEAPRAGLPNGRLWISDGAGVRAFSPAP